LIIDKRKIHHLDLYLIVNGLVLFGIGIMNLVSATSSMYGGTFGFIIKQLVAFLIGVILILVMLQSDYRLIASYGKWLYGAGLLAVILVLVIGGIAGGARRWITIAGISMQPSEFMKPILVICLACLLHEKKKAGQKLGIKDLAIPLGATVLPFILIIKQPDLGTGIIVLVTALSIFWFVGLKRSTYFALFGVGTILPIIAWRYLLKPYQKMRVVSFINLDADPSGFGYHAKQALIAVGSGRFFGKGYMSGTQHKLQFIPEHHTDFIYTVIAEEWGFLGSMVLFVLFISFIYRCMKVSQEAGDELGSIMAFGMTAIIFWQFVINIFMSIHLAPVVGIPLPFISYGGSSLLTVLVSVGIILNIRMRRYMF
jgi:rod shape determining protein RodA